jgi:hypothetical protein
MEQIWYLREETIGMMSKPKEYLRARDKLVVYKFDRLARSSM